MLLIYINKVKERIDSLDSNKEIPPDLMESVAGFLKLYLLFEEINL
jgi:hypothetical protein